MSSTTAVPVLSTVSSTGSHVDHGKVAFAAADDGELHSVDSAGSFGRSLGLVGRHEDLHGGDHSGPDPAVVEALQSLVGRTASRE